MTVNVASRGGESGQFKRGGKKTTKNKNKHIYENYLRLIVLNMNAHNKACVADTHPVSLLSLSQRLTQTKDKGS